MLQYLEYLSINLFIDLGNFFVTVFIRGSWYFCDTAKAFGERCRSPEPSANNLLWFDCSDTLPPLFTHIDRCMHYYWFSFFLFSGICFPPFCHSTSTSKYSFVKNMFAFWLQVLHLKSCMLLPWNVGNDLAVNPKFLIPAFPSFLSLCASLLLLPCLVSSLVGLPSHERLF